MFAIASSVPVGTGAPSAHRAQEGLELAGVGGTAGQALAACARGRLDAQAMEEVWREGIQDAQASTRPLDPARDVEQTPRQHRADGAAGGAARERELDVHRAIHAGGQAASVSRRSPVAPRRRACARSAARSSPCPWRHHPRARAGSGCPSCSGSAHTGAPRRGAARRSRRSRRSRACGPRGGDSASGTPPSRSARSPSPTAATARASSALAVKGFSHSTCFPARSARIVHTPCRPFGSGL